MSQLAAHNLAMSNFYGTQQGDQYGSKQPTQGEGQVLFRYASMIVGLLSLFTIIALNVTNIIYMTGSGGTMESIKNSQQSLSGIVKETSGVIIEDIKPKTDLINSMVSYNLPSQLTIIHNLIKNEVLRQCTPSFMFNNTICPIAENPTHSHYLEELNLEMLSECRNPNGYLEVKSPIEYVEYPSFIPGSTKPGSCTRLPSFSMSSTVFAYTHTIMGHGCSELDVGDHYFSIGRIADHGHEQPIFETLTEWFINDKINRRSCTVAAGKLGAWMGCVIMTETFFDDVESSDTGRITISFMDVFGRKKEWMYSKSEIHYDQVYTALYFSVGSGAVIGDTVYFLVWGTLRDLVDQPAYCVAPGCINYDQRRCNEAQRPEQFGHRQVVNGLLSFKTNVDGKPSLLLRTFSPSDVPLGSEGRLIHFENLGRTFIYIRSTGWHSLPLTGLLNLGPPISITWTVQTAVSRPGDHPCGASNRCPRDCVTGVYTDLYPLGYDYEYTATTFLNAELYRVNPTIALTNTSKSVYTKTLTNPSQQAGYTTTTCFVFKLRVWCLSIVELSPATITAFEPVPFLFQLDIGCRNLRTGNLDPLSGKDQVYKLGRFQEPRNECFFERIDQHVYFIISIPGSIQAYEVRDLDPSATDRVNPYITDVCSLALEAFKKMTPSTRKSISIMVGHWQFRPVQVGRGVRLEFSNGFLGRVDPKLVAPEDPGFETFPGEHLSASACVQDLELCYRALEHDSIDLSTTAANNTPLNSRSTTTMTPATVHGETSQITATGKLSSTIVNKSSDQPRVSPTLSEDQDGFATTAYNQTVGRQDAPVKTVTNKLMSTSASLVIIGANNTTTQSHKVSTEGVTTVHSVRSTGLLDNAVPSQFNASRNRSEAHDDDGYTHHELTLPGTEIGKTPELPTFQTGIESTADHDEDDITPTPSNDSRNGTGVNRTDQIESRSNTMTSTLHAFADYYNDGVKKGVTGTIIGTIGYLGNYLTTTIRDKADVISSISNDYTTSSFPLTTPVNIPQSVTNNTQNSNKSTENYTITTVPDSTKPSMTNDVNAPTTTHHFTSLVPTSQTDPNTTMLPDSTEHPPHVTANTSYTNSVEDRTSTIIDYNKQSSRTSTSTTLWTSTTTAEDSIATNVTATDENSRTAYNSISPPHNSANTTTAPPVNAGGIGSSKRQTTEAAQSDTYTPTLLLVINSTNQSISEDRQNEPTGTNKGQGNQDSEHITKPSMFTTTQEMIKSQKKTTSIPSRHSSSPEISGNHIMPTVDPEIKHGIGHSYLAADPGVAAQNLLLGMRNQEIMLERKLPRFTLTKSECPPSMHDQLCYEIKRYMRVLEDKCSGSVSLNVPLLAVGYVLTSTWRQSNNTYILPPMYYLCMENKETVVSQLPEHTYYDPKNGENKEIRWGSFALDLKTWSRREDEIPMLPFSKKDMMVIFGDIDPSIPSPFCVVLEVCGYPVVVYNNGRRYIPFMMYTPADRSNPTWRSHFDSKDICYQLYRVILNTDEMNEYYADIGNDQTPVTLRTITDLCYMSYTALGGECFDREYSRSYVYSYLRYGNTDVYSMYSFDFDTKSEIVGFGSYQVEEDIKRVSTEKMSLDPFNNMKSVYNRFWN
ncbi:attachment glycoprotein [Rodent paramyxovirus]|uniref:Attachment glycoprotein n=1 Tax=Rodent paramyxovirus TaxID=1497434 RepID=A0AAD0ABR2_9MONO|nr:attachment glycoprotein [Rodent paramyxovirus]ATP66852.1 attachment glycoprotein [Rodent paramyxovirus]